MGLKGSEIDQVNSAGSLEVNVFFFNIHYTYCLQSVRFQINVAHSRLTGLHESITDHGGP